MHRWIHPSPSSEEYTLIQRGQSRSRVYVSLLHSSWLFHVLISRFHCVCTDHPYPVSSILLGDLLINLEISLWYCVPEERKQERAGKAVTVKIKGFSSTEFISNNDAKLNVALGCQFSILTTRTSWKPLDKAMLELRYSCTSWSYWRHTTVCTYTWQCSLSSMDSKILKTQCQELGSLCLMQVCLGLGCSV